MRQLTALVQTSLDGFVAGPNGEFDLFLGGEENLAFVCGITRSADALLAGRVSYEMLDSHWPTAGQQPGATANTIAYSNWYNSVPKYVLSNTLQSSGKPNTQVIAGNIATAINNIKAGDGKAILIFGSPTAMHHLLELQLVDSIWLIVHPVVFGSGIPFLKSRDHSIQLELRETSQLSNGTLCNHYFVRR